MERNLPPLPVRILVILIVLSAIGYFGYQLFNPTDNGQLDASGTIESVVVNVSPEMAGKVVDVLADEGQPVQVGGAQLGRNKIGCSFEMRSRSWRLGKDSAFASLAQSD